VQTNSGMATISVTASVQRAFLAQRVDTGRG
jgi:hypothetical protein